MSRETGGVKFALAQINPTVGDLAGNLAKMIHHCRAARDENANAVVFPELAVSGYPPEDLLLRDDFLAECARRLRELGEAAAPLGVTVVVGHPLAENGKVFNALSVLCGGETRALYRKRHLPNYTVFDEKRYFTAGRRAAVADIGGLRVGLTICEDIWHRRPVAQSAELGADLIVAINASPFHNEQAFVREEGVVRKKARRFRLPMIYLNQVGGQDGLVFDGSSVVVNAGGEVAARLPAFREAMQCVEFHRPAFAAGRVEARLQSPELIYRALVLGVRDYIDKNQFSGAVLGLSGGIDSALSLAIAVDALGHERVTAVMLPSRHTSAMSLEDARAEAQTLGVRYQEISIEPLYRAALGQLQAWFAGRAADATEENIQARCRGLLLMALSNKFGYLVLTTGNKSEMAVGYATLYGDMAGGFSALKDVPKTLVYDLAAYRNSVSPAIPERVLKRAPTAELAPHQKDQDSLPPYDILDPILEAFVERDHSPEQIIAAGFEPATVRRVVAMVVANEYKRRQAAPGVRVTSRAFGKDRRYPITSRFF
ncbi:MAG: NAD+ synthase [Gammaproteobacteria bacterium]|nr:NAD+ synthase [Gammaproteobacteria bacterium]